jgi:polygalacturonase
MAPRAFSCRMQLNRAWISRPALVALTLTVLGHFAPESRAETVSFPENFQPALPVIPARDFSLVDFGAVGDGKTLNTEAFTKAVAAVDRAGGGKLVVPKGIFRTLPFVLCSNLELHLEAGAIIQAPDTFEGWGLPDPSTLQSQDEVKARVKTPEPLITGHKLHDLAITGTGTIDGNGALWWAWSERAERAQPGRLVYGRPHLVVINGCERLLVADITLTNSSMFHLVTKDITDLTVERVRVRAPFNAPNTDAIDPGPVTNALIRDCDIDTGDDDICIKTGASNVLIEGCTIRHGHGISIGSPTSGGIHNMLVRHCTLDGADNGIRIKSMRGAGGTVENVRYTDIQMKNVANAIVLDMNYVDNNRPDFKGDPAKIPAFHDIRIDHVTAVKSANAGKIVGLPDSPIARITLQNVQIAAENDFVIKDASQLIFENMTLSIMKGVAPARPAFVE